MQARTHAAEFAASFDKATRDVLLFRSLGAISSAG